MAASRKRSSSATSRKHSASSKKKTIAVGGKQIDPIYGFYPPQHDDDGYYRYTKGRVHQMPRSLNTFLLLPLVFAGFGCGHFMNLFMMMINHFFNFREGYIPIDFTNMYHVTLCLAVGMVFTVAAYYFGCRHVEKEFYDSQESRSRSEEWKCKPYQWLSADLRREEIFYGCVNAAIGSFAGISIFIYQQLPTTAPGTVKIYYDIQDPLYARWGTQLLGGWPTYVLTTVVYFVAADFWAFWSHKTLHWPFLYRHVHKLHHQFKSVSPFGAYALHPLEFIFIMSGFQGFVFFFPLHFSSLALNLVYIGYHAILDHAGVDFDGWFSFSPSTMFHDDHHTHFHCNFGQSLVFWDWMFGTLRRIDKKYGVENFHD